MCGYLLDHFTIEMQMHLKLQVLWKLLGDRVDVDTFGDREGELDIVANLCCELGGQFVEPNELTAQTVPTTARNHSGRRCA